MSVDEEEGSTCQHVQSIANPDDQDGGFDCPDADTPAAPVNEAPAHSGSSSSATTLSVLPSTEFNKIKIATNLKQPPENWLTRPYELSLLTGFIPGMRKTWRTNKDSIGVGSNLPFSSFKLAASCPEAIHKFQIEIVASADAIKDLIMMPHMKKLPVSLLILPVGNTLFLEKLDVLDLMMRTSDHYGDKWMQNAFINVLFSGLEKKGAALARRNTKNTALQFRNLFSKFLYRSIEENSRPTVQDHACYPLQQEQERPSQLPRLPEAMIEGGSTPEFARKVFWTFEDVRMLVGSNMPIFGDSEHPSVSLRLHDMSKPINILTGLDYWLDNLICQIPEVLMCYHIDGVVQRYEPIKTEDIPRNCQFNPKFVCDVARHIISFLKDSAVKEGHTYWLFKAKDDEGYSKLYDLTQLCEENDEDALEEAVQKQNPYKKAMAQSILKDTDNEPEDLLGAKALLEEFLSLVDVEAYPHFVSSAHFLLADIYVPRSIHPENPNFNLRMKSTPHGHADKKNSRRPNEGGGVSKQTKQANVITCDFRNLPEVAKDRKRFKASNLPLPKDIYARCHEALRNVLKGLKHLEELARKKSEFAEKARKEQEYRERDSQPQANPNEAIPMPFGGDQKENSEVVPYNGQPDANAAPVKDPHLWHDDLEILLLRKAHLVYVTLAWQYSNDGMYGKCLRNLKYAKNCRSVANIDGETLPKEEAFVEVLLLLAAGSTYAQFFRDWTNMVTYQEEFNNVSDATDSEISQYIERHSSEEDRDWSIKLPVNDLEAIVSGIEFHRKGILLIDESYSHLKSKERFLSHYKYMLELFSVNSDQLYSRHVDRAKELLQEYLHAKDTGPPLSVMKLKESMKACLTEADQHIAGCSGMLQRLEVVLNSSTCEVSKVKFVSVNIMLTYNQCIANNLRISTYQLFDYDSKNGSHRDLLAEQLTSYLKNMNTCFELFQQYRSKFDKLTPLQGEQCHFIKNIEFNILNELFQKHKSLLDLAINENHLTALDTLVGFVKPFLRWSKRAQVISPKCIGASIQDSQILGMLLVVRNLSMTLTNLHPQKCTRSIRPEIDANPDKLSKKFDELREWAEDLCDVFHAKYRTAPAACELITVAQLTYHELDVWILCITRKGAPRTRFRLISECLPRVSRLVAKINFIPDVNITSARFVNVQFRNMTSEQREHFLFLLYQSTVVLKDLFAEAFWLVSQTDLDLGDRLANDLAQERKKCIKATLQALYKHVHNNTPRENGEQYCADRISERQDWIKATKELLHTCSNSF